MPAIFEYPHIVADAEIDEFLRHVNNLAYLRWMQTAAMAHSAAQGWPAEAYLKLGAGWVVRSHKIEYLSPALPGDEIIVRTWVADLGKATSLRRYKIVRAGGAQEVVLAVAATDWAFVRFADYAPRRIPVEVASAFEIVSDNS